MTAGVARAALAGLALIGCARDLDTAGLDVVRIADRGFLSNAPIHIADAGGFFADEGIRLEFTDTPNSSTQVIPLLERGEIDVTMPSVNAGFYAAVAQGGRSRIVADRGHIATSGCDYSGVVARRGLFSGNSAVAADLRGKRFSVAPAGMTEFVVEKYLWSLGLTTSDLRTVRLRENVEEQAIEAGAIDALYVVEPYLSRLLAAGHRLIGPSRTYAAGAQFAVIVFGPSLTVDNRALGQRFMKAYLRGVREYRKGATPQNVEIMSRRSGFDPKVLRTICLPTIEANGELNMPGLLEFQTWAVKNGHLSRVLGASAGTDLSFARRAARDLGIAPSRR